MKVIIGLLLFCLFHMQQFEDTEIAFSYPKSTQAVKRDNGGYETLNLNKRRGVGIGKEKRKRQKQNRIIKKQSKRSKKNIRKKKAQRKRTQNKRRKGGKGNKNVKKKADKQRKQKKEQAQNYKNKNKTKKDNGKVIKKMKMYKKMLKMQRKHKMKSKQNKTNNLKKKGFQNVTSSHPVRQTRCTLDSLPPIPTFDDPIVDDPFDPGSTIPIPDVVDSVDPKDGRGTGQYQVYECDMLHNIRAFSTGKTQLNSANIIINKRNKLTNYISRSSQFNNIILALEHATNYGATCASGDPDLASTILASLAVCPTTIPSRCALPACSDLTTVHTCQTLLQKFAQEFKWSIFGRGVQFAPLQAFVISDVKDVCERLDTKVFPSNINDPVTGWFVGQPTLTTPLSTLKSLKCIPKTFTNMKTVHKNKIRECEDPTLIYSGSWGSCMYTMLQAINYVNLCRPNYCSSALIPTIVLFIYVPPAIIVINAIVININLIRCHNAFWINCYSHSEFISLRNTESQLNFTDIISALNTSTVNGTTCNGAPLSNEGKSVYNTLKMCSTSIPAICNPSEFESEYEHLNGRKCSGLLNDFVKEYKLCFNGKNITTVNQTGLTDQQKKMMNKPLSGSNLRKLIEGCCKKINVSTIETDVDFLSGIYEKSSNINGNPSYSYKELYVFYQESRWIVSRGTSSDSDFIMELKYDTICPEDMGKEWKTKNTKNKDGKISVDCNDVVPSDTQQRSFNQKQDQSWNSNKKKHCEELISLTDKITEANCLNEQFTNLAADVNKTLSACRNTSVLGSYANCAAAKEAAISYINTCKTCTTSSSLTTSRVLGRRILGIK